MALVFGDNLLERFRNRGPPDGSAQTSIAEATTADPTPTSQGPVSGPSLTVEPEVAYLDEAVRSRFRSST